MVALQGYQIIKMCPLLCNSSFQGTVTSQSQVKTELFIFSVVRSTHSFHKQIEEYREQKDIHLIHF